MALDFYKKLTFKHTFMTIAVVFVCGTIISLFQVLYDLYKNKKEVENNIETIIEITEESAAQSLYHLDKVQAEKIINGYIKYDPVVNVALVDNFGLTLSSRNIKKKNNPTLLNDFIFPETQNYSFNLQYSPDNVDPISVGRVEIQLDYTNMYGEFLKKAKLFLYYDILIHVLLAGIIAFIFYRTLTRPLIKLSGEITSINPSSPEDHELNIPKNNASDEIGSLISNINLILNEYASLNIKLEQRVQERTLELENANSTLKQSLYQLKKAKNQLVESEKMASLGGLVAGVSHEINTPVGNCVTATSFLQGNIEDIKKKLKSEELSREELDELLLNADEAMDIILKNLERASDLISSFKQVAVDQTYSAMRFFSLKKHIQDTLTSLKPRFKGRNISINFKCEESMYIFHDPGIFSQIITNLSVNSVIHGFENSDFGIINIELKTDTKDILLKYCDSGKGLSKEAKKKIFEPFYTTKKNKGGSGLGMHIVYNLVSQRLNGKIKCTTGDSGKGVCFHILFPFPEE